MLAFITVCFAINIIPINCTAQFHYKDIACGYWHNVALMEDGTIETWGANWYGQLGNGTYESSYLSGKVNEINNVIEVASGACHSLALKKDGSVWAWGANDYGQLGNGTRKCSIKPNLVNGLEDIIAIACGESHSLALKKDGSIWAWGYNYFGQLGNGTMTDSLYPIKVSEITNVKKIEAGSKISMAIKNDGSVWIWGSNINGILGNTGYKQCPFPVKIESLSNIVSLACGGSHCLALCKDGSVWAWGANGNGQLGNGNTLQSKAPVKVKDLGDVRELSCGESYSIALKKDGSVWIWGGDTYLGDGCERATTIAKKVKQVKNITSISSGYKHNIIIDSNKSIWAWGSNWMGELGADNTGETNYPIKLFIYNRNSHKTKLGSQPNISSNNSISMKFNLSKRSLTNNKCNNEAIPNEGMFGEQWGLYNQRKSSGFTVTRIDINAISAWEINNGDSSVMVGLLDSGVDISHVDLSANIYENQKETINGVDDDYNGFIDDVNGWDFYNNDNTIYDSKTEDIHGTQIAGVIAASENGKGIIGVAPNIKILPLKFMGNEGGSIIDAIRAIEYADGMGVKIINCSWGWKGSRYNRVLEAIMKSKDILFICASGNKFSDESNFEFFPACFNCPNILSVTAINFDGILDPNSNYGDQIDVAAPGVDIITTMPENKYGSCGGSSIAVPFVTGVAALIKSEKADISPISIIDRILVNSKYIQKLNGKVKCSGIVDAYASIKDLN